MGYRGISLVTVLCFFAFTLVSVSATNCWDYDSSELLCNAQDDCIYFSDEWGGWCGELKCWNLFNQEQCTNTTLTSSAGINCQWSDSTGWGWCGMKSCWSFSNTNQSYCENSSAHNMTCEWNNNCHGSNPDVDCWSLTEADCSNTSGCEWGDCMDKGCWSYGSADCTSNVGTHGKQCQWDSSTVTVLRVRAGIIQAQTSPTANKTQQD